MLPGADLTDGIQDNEWNGERLFQAAKFGTETQYQHLVFEEFARKVAPTIHLFGNNDIHLDPAITAEFAHAVYRFGHSMLDENVNRYQIGPDGTPVLDADGHPVLNEIGLIDAFLNPLEFAAHGANAAGEIVLGIDQPGRQRDRRVRHRRAAQQPARPAARPRRAQHRARPRHRRAAAQPAAQPDYSSQTGDTTR